jgi:hypothetical protein
LDHPWRCGRLRRARLFRGRACPHDDVTVETRAAAKAAAWDGFMVLHRVSPWH